MRFKNITFIRNIAEMILIIIISSGINNFAVAEFVTTYGVDSLTMKKIEEWTDKNTVIFIEIDDTIMMPKANMFSFDSNPNRNFISNMAELGDRMPTYNEIIARWYQQREIKLVEDEWVGFINRLKAKGASVYGMCTMPIHLLNIEQRRWLEANNLGIIFTKLMNNKEEFEIERQGQWSSSFYNGIIFTGPYSQSHTLMELYKIMHIFPSKTLVIGSSKNEVQRIERKLRIYNMKYYNVHYLGARNVKGRPNPEIVKIQQRELINSGRWLEDEIAAQFLVPGE
jgi:hypothetical protein